MARQRVVLLQAGHLPGAPTPAPSGVMHAPADQFIGVPEALARRGYEPVRSLTTDHRPDLPDGTAAVAVADCLSPVCRHALRLARERGLPTVLLMDGVCEWRNTYLNPRVGPAFLSPAPVHEIACGGELDRRLLTAMGNTARATGLPRLDGAPRDLAPCADGPLLIATARTPWFTPRERERVLTALEAVRDEAARLSLALRWRIPDVAAAMLGVSPDHAPLGESLRASRAALTLPSTLLSECMLAGLPTGLLHPFDTPTWHTAPRVWGGEACAPTEHTTPAGTAHAELRREPAFGRKALREMLAALLDPTPHDMDRQRRLRDELAEPGLAADRVAGLITTLAQRSPASSTTKPAPKLLSLAARPAPMARAPGKHRVVNIVQSDAEPSGGVWVWATRMAHAFAQRATGYDVRTLLVTRVPVRVPEWAERVTDLCVIPEDMDHTSALETVRRAIVDQDPAAVIPNWGDLAHAAAALVRPLGVRTIGVLHADEPASRRALAQTGPFDALVGVSDRCAELCESIASEHNATLDTPIESIPCGVPVEARPRTVSPGGPLRIAICGRMSRHQKRIHDLPFFAAELERLGTEGELHLIGDGPDLNSTLAELRKLDLKRVRTIVQGPLDADSARERLIRCDVLLMLSAFEGTSQTLLEAMGAGVVPAVTRIPSGLGPWIIEGQTGVTAPIGAPSEMARLVADLAADRRRLARIGADAWRHARERASITRACDQWAALLHDALHARPKPMITDAGLRLHDASRWRKTWADDPRRAADFATARLRELGYVHVSIDEPDHRAEAVVITGPVSPETARDAQLWRRAGLGVVLAQALIEPEWVRMAAILEEAVDAGCQRLAVFGCGQHTRRARELFARDLPIVGIIDDEPSVLSLFGLPVVRTERERGRLAPDAVILSSDAYEDRLWDRAELFREAGVRVMRVHGEPRVWAAGDVDAAPSESSFTIDRTPPLRAG